MIQGWVVKNRLEISPARADWSGPNVASKVATVAIVRNR